MQNPYADIPEIADLDAARGLIRIPVEQDVPFTPRVRAIVDTPEFRRLGRISQLGLASLVYPGATHTRFEHALGVFHNAVRYVRQLSRHPRFQQVADAHTVEVLLCAALLHDIGHWPFCHPIEDMGLADLPPHEVFAGEFLSAGTPLAAALVEHWRVEPQEILDVLSGHGGPPQLRLLRSILSGPIDIDKLDYLDRDSLHAGVPYGRNFDKNRLMQSLVLNKPGDGLALSAKGRTAAELMVFARYVMFSEVYWHHAVRAATSMFARAFYHLHRKLDLRSLFRQSEWATIETMRQHARGTACEALIEGLFGPVRRLYKRVCEFSHDRTPELHDRLARRPFAFLADCAERLSERLSASLGVSLQPTDILIDAPPVHREVEFDVQIYFPKEDAYRPFHEVSPVVEALARTQFDDQVKRVRIFAHPDRAAQIARAATLQSDLERVLDDAG